MATWGFLTNHAVVLLHLAGHSNSTLREISKTVGLTERSVITIIQALEEEGIASHTRDGRRNIYQIHYPAVMKHLRGQTEPFSFQQLAAQMTALAARLDEDPED
jgi:DNA-binding IclR family transcriptional regulator